MKIKVSDIRGKTIISEKGGKILGTADDVVYDTSKMKIIAILSNISKGLAMAKAIPIKSIKNISDSIIIKSEEDYKPVSEVIHFALNPTGKAEFLAGTKLVTDKGQEMGKLKDIVFDSKSGQVMEAETIQQGQKKPVKVEKIISSSNETTVVKGKEKKSSEEILENNPLIKKLKKVSESLS
jgi:uncharacterized protein YrrD